MALDPLKFAVSIQDDVTGKLDAIERKLNSIKEHTITIKVDDRNLKDALNIDKLFEQIQQAKSALKGNSFETFDKHMNNAADSVERLTKNLSGFESTIKDSNGLRNYLSGLGEVIKNLRSVMTQVNVGNQSSVISPDTIVRSANMAKHEVERLGNTLVNAQRTIERFGDKGFDTARLERYKSMLIEVRENLKLIQDNKGFHPITGLTAGQYLSSEDVSRVVSLMNTELGLYKNIGNEIERIVKLRNELSSTLASNRSSSYAGALDSAIAGLDLRQGLLARLGPRDALQSLNTDSYRSQLAEASELLSKVSAETRQTARDSKQAQTENEKWAASMNTASIAATNLRLKIQELEQVRDRGKAANIDVKALEQQITKMKDMLAILQSMEAGMKIHGFAGDFLKSAPYRNTLTNANVEADAINRNASEKEKAARASQQLSTEEQRLAQALNHTTESARGQSQVLSDLKSMATQYLGVWGGQQFIHNIIEIGGQLEMQRLSIGAILQNTAHANELFEKIKGLATQSPFGVVQLDQMTKQLTAYGFKYNELYDMTKRLADISAATGTDVSRLALALGHVRSEAALSGYTLRQFSMANVPLLQKLSEKLGKTSKEIRDMVKKKEIGYSDVIDVLKGLTDEGGMFYNMQEVISQSVKAKFKNVKDAMDIMYGEMAEGAPGDVLKKVAEVLMDVTKNWKDAATIIGTGAAVWATHRAAVLAMNAALGSNTSSVTANIMAYKQKRAAELQSEAMTRKLTADELALVATRNKITAANIRVALSTNAITKGEALRLVGLRKLSLEEAKALIRSGEFTAAEVRMALQGRVLGMNLGFAGNMMKSFAASAKLAITALLTNPWTWAIAGITAMVELWQRNNQELERSKELSEDIYNRSQEGLKNTRTMMQNTGIRVDWRNGKNDQWDNVTGTFGQQTGGFMRFVKPSFDKNHDIEGTIEAWQQYIRDYAATPNRILNNAMTYQVSEKGEDGIEKVTTKVRELRDQYDLLYESVINVSKAQKQMQNTSDAIGFAINETNKGLFDDDMLTNIGDYDSQVKKVAQNIAKTYGDLRKYIDDTVKKAQKEDKDFAEATKGMDNYSQAFAHLVKNHEEFSKADEIFKDAHFGVSGAYEGLLDGGLFDGGTMSGFENARKTMEKDLNTFFTSLDNQLRNQKGWHIDDVLAGSITLSEDKQQALLSSWKDALSKVRGLTDETAHELTQKFAERYRITIDADTENAIAKLAQLEQSLNNLVEGDYKVNVETMTNAKSVFDQMKKDYKAAKEYIETSKPILAKFGIAITGKSLGLMKITEITNGISDKGVAEEVRKVLIGYDQAISQLNKAQEGANNLGLKLEDDKKKKGGRNKTGGTKSYKDEFAKRWDERIRIMKEAHDWYRKWEKEVGHDEAIKETFAKYQDIFKEWKEDKILPLDFDVNDIDDFQKYVEKIYKDALDRYNKQKNNKLQNYGQEAQRVYRQAAAVLEDIKFDNLKKAAEEFRSIIDQTIEDLNERWDIFDAVRNSTGNVDLATHIAGFGAAETGARTSADAMRNELLNQLRSAGGEKLLSQIPLDVKIDEEGLREKFEKAIPQGEDAERYKEKIDGLIKAYQEWQKLQRKVVKDDISVYANLIGAVVSYDAKIKKMRDELEKKKASNNALFANGTITQADADNANQIAQAQFDWESMKMSADYANIYNHAVAMSREEFNNAAGAIDNMLEKLRRLGLISPDDFVSEKGKLDKARNEWSTTGFLGERGAVGSFISGGNDGLMNYYAQRRDKALQQEKNAKPGSEDQKKYAKEAEHYGKLFDKMSKLSDAAKDVITAFNTLQSGLDLVTNMFDSLGMEGAADTTSDAAGVLGGAMQGASALSALGPYGMAAGAGLGLISGLAQVHDKALERQISKLREDVQKIEANTKLIQQARERTLGFDLGDLRRGYAQNYAPNQTQAMKDILASLPYLRNNHYLLGFDSKAQKDMYEYYSQNSEGSGYRQEFQNLIDQRKDYMDILDAQESKKKKSQSDIEETKAKISELDDQIRYFSMDLAKELFDIDVKGWADQLSDALSSAFENGESMAKAYKETVTSILQQVMNKMMQLAILEPMFQSLQDKLFGNADKNISGVFNPNDPKGSMSKVTAMITDFFGNGGEGQKTITAATEFMTAFQRGLENSGLSVLNESANALTSSVQGTSEETSDLLAGYINALRQDVSVNRILLTQFVAQLWPEYVEAFANHVRTVSNIDVNVQLMMEMMRDGSGAFFNEISSLRSRFDSVVDGIESMSVK